LAADPTPLRNGLGGRAVELTEFDEKTLALYAKGMTMREIQEIVKELYEAGPFITIGWACRGQRLRTNSVRGKKKPPRSGKAWVVLDIDD